MRKWLGSYVIAFSFVYFALGLFFNFLEADNNFIWVGVALLLLGLLFYYAGESDVVRKWKTWPTLDEYIKLYPQTATNSGIACYKCRSKKIFQFGFEKRDDVKRIHKCMICNTFLYRTKHQT